MKGKNPFISVKSDSENVILTLKVTHKNLKPTLHLKFISPSHFPSTARTSSHIPKVILIIYLASTEVKTQQNIKNDFWYGILIKKTKIIV